MQFKLCFIMTELEYQDNKIKSILAAKETAKKIDSALKEFSENAGSGFCIIISILGNKDNGTLKIGSVHNLMLINQTSFEQSLIDLNDNTLR